MSGTQNFFLPGTQQISLFCGAQKTHNCDIWLGPRLEKKTDNKTPTQQGQDQLFTPRDTKYNSKYPNSIIF